MDWGDEIGVAWSLCGALCSAGCLGHGPSSVARNRLVEVGVNS
jgi:hypothetical protein